MVCKHFKHALQGLSFLHSSQIKYMRTEKKFSNVTRMTRRMEQLPHEKQSNRLHLKNWLLEIQERYINLGYMNTELLLPLPPDAAENFKCDEKFQVNIRRYLTMLHRLADQHTCCHKKSWVFHWLRRQLYKHTEENPLAIKATIDSVSPWVQISGCWSSLPKQYYTLCWTFLFSFGITCCRLDAGLGQLLAQPGTTILTGQKHTKIISFIPRSSQSSLLV